MDHENWPILLAAVASLTLSVFTASLWIQLYPLGESQARGRKCVLKYSSKEKKTFSFSRIFFRDSFFAAILQCYQSSENLRIFFNEIRYLLRSYSFSLHPRYNISDHIKILCGALRFFLPNVIREFVLESSLSKRCHLLLEATVELIALVFESVFRICFYLFTISLVVLLLTFIYRGMFWNAVAIFCILFLSNVTINRKPKPKELPIVAIVEFPNKVYVNDSQKIQLTLYYREFFKALSNNHNFLAKENTKIEKQELVIPEINNLERYTLKVRLQAPFCDFDEPERSYSFSENSEKNIVIPSYGQSFNKTRLNSRNAPIDFFPWNCTFKTSGDHEFSINFYLEYRDSSNSTPQFIGSINLKVRVVVIFGLTENNVWQLSLISGSLALVTAAITIVKAVQDMNTS